MKMSEDNAGDTPGGRTSSDLETPAATQFDKKGNVSIVINSGVKRRSKKWSQRKDTDVVGMTMRRNFIYGGENGVGCVEKDAGGFRGFRAWQGFIIFIILACSQSREDIPFSSLILWLDINPPRSPIRSPNVLGWNHLKTCILKAASARARAAKP